jgi:hypothetical protein
MYPPKSSGLSRRTLSLIDAKDTDVQVSSQRGFYPWGNSRFMMNQMSIASWGLFIGAIGQEVFYGYLFPHLATWIVTGISLLPWLTVFVISFCGVAPFGPRRFRYSLVFAMCWYTVVTLLAEILYLLTRPAASKNFSIIVARVSTYLGFLSFIVFVRVVFVLRRPWGWDECRKQV